MKSFAKKIKTRMLRRFLADELINSAYRGILGRAPDSSGMKAYRKVLADEGGLTSVLSIMTRSEEFRSQISTATDEYAINGDVFHFTDRPNSRAVQFIVNEINAGQYDFNKIKFEPGDVVVDIGAHVGVISICLAKKYPFIEIHSYEPTPVNFLNLKINIWENDVKNITAHNLAVTKDGSDFEMLVGSANTGGATGQLKNMHLPGHKRFTAKSTTLDSIFGGLSHKKCKLLKIDCEGTEHEVLLNCEALGKAEFLRGEFHVNTKLREEGYSNERLLEHCAKYIKKENIDVACIEMADY